MSVRTAWLVSFNATDHPVGFYACSLCVATNTVGSMEILIMTRVRGQLMPSTKKVVKSSALFCQQEQAD